MTMNYTVQQAHLVEKGELLSPAAAMSATMSATMSAVASTRKTRITTGILAVIAVNTQFDNMLVEDRLCVLGLILVGHLNPPEKCLCFTVRNCNPI